MAEIVERGKIRNREWAKQLRDFSGLRFGNITPTDIDGFADFGNRVFIFIEAKYGNTKCEGGQRLAFERLCDGCQKAGVQTYFLIVEHYVENPRNDIDVANCIVREFRYKGEWHFFKKEVTVRRTIERILKQNDLEYYIRLDSLEGETSA